MPSKKQIMEYWSSNDPGSGYFEEDSRDHCFCCGRDCKTTKHHIKPIGSEPEVETPEGRARRTQKLLQNPELDDPSNIHLLCRKCHQNAPHTSDSDIYWGWFEHAPSYLSQLIAATQDGLKRAEATDYEIEAMTAESAFTPEKLTATAKRLELLHPQNDDVSVWVPATIQKLVKEFRMQHQLCFRLASGTPDGPRGDEQEKGLIYEENCGGNNGNGRREQD